MITRDTTRDQLMRKLVEVMVIPLATIDCERDAAAVCRALVGNKRGTGETTACLRYHDRQWGVCLMPPIDVLRADGDNSYRPSARESAQAAATCGDD